MFDVLLAGKVLTDNDYCLVDLRNSVINLFNPKSNVIVIIVESMARVIRLRTGYQNTLSSSPEAVLFFRTAVKFQNTLLQEPLMTQGE